MGFNSGFKGSNNCNTALSPPPSRSKVRKDFNSLNAELNPTCHLLALLGAHPILHISRIRVKVQLIETLSRLHIFTVTCDVMRFLLRAVLPRDQAPAHCRIQEMNRGPQPFSKWTLFSDMVPWKLRKIIDVPKQYAASTFTVSNLRRSPTTTP